MHTPGSHLRTTKSESLGIVNKPCWFILFQLKFEVQNSKGYFYISLLLCLQYVRGKNMCTQSTAHLVKASIENFPNFRSFKSNSLKIPAIVIVEIC